MKVYAAEAAYPYGEPDFITAWNEEGALLAAALNAPDEAGARRSARISAKPASRRLRFSLGPDLLAFERELEWLEGLGKYAEGRFSELAAATAGKPADASLVPADPLKRMDAARLEKQLGRQEGDLRFYLSGPPRPDCLTGCPPVGRESSSWRNSTSRTPSCAFWDLSQRGHDPAATLNVDLAWITPQDLEEIVSNLDDMTVEVDGKDKVRIFCE